MKIYTHLLALCVFHANVWETTAFSVKAAKATAAVVLRSSRSEDPEPIVIKPSRSASKKPELATFLTTGTQQGPVKSSFSELAASGDLQLLTPTFPKLERFEGGGRINTYQMPPWAERCQMIFATNGRPLTVDVELMLGPLRTTHQLKLDIEDGNVTPYQATLKFKKANQVLRITSKAVNQPLLVGVYVPSPQKSKELEANTEKVWDTVQKALLQGGTTSGGAGAKRYWTVPPNVQSVQVLVWARDTGKKSLKVTLEVSEGPENKKQAIFLQCGGGSQPYHAVLQTPNGGSIGVQNKKFVEDGLVEIAFVPYEVGDSR
jgi:hypothetical protein